MIKGVLFDMDGVLLDTEQLGMRVMKEAAAGYGYTVTDEMYLRILGVTRRESKRILLDVLGESYPYEAVMEAFWEVFMQKIKAGEMVGKAGLAECLAGLKERHILIALATSTQRDVVELYQEKIQEFRGAFDAVVCGTDVAHGKPAPDIYLRAAEELGLPKEECIGVEDSKNGLLSITAAGVRSVMIPDVLPYDDSLAPIVNWKLDSLMGLCPLIDRLNRERE